MDLQTGNQVSASQSSSTNNKRPQKQQDGYTSKDLHYMLFYIDRQLSSTQPQQMQKGITQLTKFLTILFENKIKQIKNGYKQCMSLQEQRRAKLEILAPIVVRLLDLFLNSKIFSHKKYVSEVLICYADYIKDTTAREELVQVLTKGIKGVDQYTRVMAAKTIPYYTEAFQKDLIAFQFILHKVQGFSYQQKLTVNFTLEKQSLFGCLKSMLSKSVQLSQIFVKNLQSQSKQLDSLHPSSNLLVNLIKIDTFYQFCLSSKFSPTNSLIVFKNLLETYKRRSQIILQLSKQIHGNLKVTLQKIFVRFYPWNFRVIQTLYDQQMDRQINVDLDFVRKYFTRFDRYQQQYIIKSCPYKLRSILIGNQITGNPTTGNQITGNPTTGNQITGNPTTGNQITGNQITGNQITGPLDKISPKKQMFLKFLLKINQFKGNQLDDPSRCLIIKKRRIMQLIQLCEFKKTYNLCPLLAIWIQINAIISLLASNMSSQKIQLACLQVKQKFRLLVHGLNKGDHSIQGEIRVAAQVLLALQKCNSLGRTELVFSSFFQNMQDIPQNNRHFLRWSYLTQRTIQSLDL